ncbi:hypothetical protein VLK31_18795 [Variovorax sp. H27-G14]|uniref:hypothetical protein n=1 Tax=Variovorax sp. H27-G14 TaxID=3111914 RepID=UPI0038FC793C
MATKTIAGAPASPTSPPTSADGTTPDATDLLENTLSQLEALLWVCHGEDIDWCSGEGPRQLDNLLWLAAELARKAGELFQLSEKARAKAPEPVGK